MIGKWHLGNMDEYMPWNHGFNGVLRRRQTATTRPTSSSTMSRRRLSRGGRSIATDPPLHRPRAPVLLARAAPGGEPFFLYLAYNAPHVPLYPGAGFAGRSQRGTYGDVVEGSRERPGR